LATKKVPKSLLFSNFEILVSLFGEISPEERNPSSRVQLLSSYGFILLYLSKAKHCGGGKARKEPNQTGSYKVQSQ
jgi:hypothetical protein